MMEWISVTNRLPEIDKPVITWHMEYPDIEFMRIGYYDPSSETKSGWRDDEYCNINVTHWMPLPNPPHA